MSLKEHRAILIRTWRRWPRFSDSPNSTELQIVDFACRHHRTIGPIGPDFRPCGNEDRNRGGNPIHHQIVKDTIAYLGSFKHPQFEATAFAIVEDAVRNRDVFEVSLRQWAEANAGPARLQQAVCNGYISRRVLLAACCDRYRVVSTRQMAVRNGYVLTTLQVKSVLPLILYSEVSEKDILTS